MLTLEENELLTRTGPGTPMGELMRRYWLPAVLSWGCRKKLDRYERGILSAYNKGALVSARSTKAQLGAFRDVARATFIKNRRVNIRLSAADLMDVQARAYEEGVPYQTLIASVIHKYVSGRL